MQRCPAISALVLSLLPAFALAVNPALSRIQPYGVQRGTEAEVVFRGSRLDDAEELLLYSPGVEVLELAAENAGALKAKLRIAPDCRLGLHAVRIRSKTGISNLQLFTVGALPEIAEVEPNSEFAQPQPIEMNVTVAGVVQSEDVDYYLVEAKKGQRIVAEIEGLRLGYDFFDPYVAILNEDRFELAKSDDAALLRQDCLCSIVAPEDGKYIIEVRESAYGGSGNCLYRLHLGSFPRPTAVMPPGGKPGETIEVTWIGDPSGPFKSQVTLPEREGEFELFAEDAGGVAPSPNVVRVAALDSAIEQEPNDAREQATPASAPGAMQGVIERPGDVDYFKFTAKKGQSFAARVYAREPLRSPLDSVLRVLRANGSQVAADDDSGGPDSALNFNAPEDEEYFIEIRDHLKSGGPDFAYRIELVAPQPSLTMVLPERQRYVSTTLSVPKGNRMALMVSASRAGFGGELKVDGQGMPAGLSLEAPLMAADRSDVPVLFTASAEAATGGALADLIGAATDEGLGVVGHLKQRTMLVRGQNNRDVFGHDAERMAVAVTDEIPFTIEIVQPQVPLVKSGSMELKVVAQRQDGFTAPIRVQMLYNPPGVGSSRSISIAEGQSEAVIPLTANDGAALRSWPIVVIGSAAHGGGTVEAASQMAQLEVADRFFDFAFQKSAVEQGQQGEVVVNVTKKVDFPETASVQVLGLPAGTAAVSDTVEIKQDATEIVFPIKVEAEAKPATYKSIVCRAVIERNGEPITVTLGAGELRIDEPLPPKADAPEQSKPAAQPAAQQKPPEKRLSRLEQLRLERMQKKEGAEEQK